MLTTLGAAASAARRSNPYTQLLLHMDDISQPTTFVDSSQFARTITPEYGGTNPFAKSDAQYKFGNCSVYKSAYSNSPGASLRVSGPVDWMKSDDRNYCIDFWIRFTALSADKYLQMLYATGSGNPEPLYRITYRPSLMDLIFNFGTIESWFSIGFTPSLNTWYHMAMTKVNNVGYTFVNGVLQNSIAVTPAYQTPSSLRVGYSQETSGDSFQWYMDEIRFSFGENNYWTSNFTPPATPYE